jgi:hypothetical protein
VVITVAWSRIIDLPCNVSRCDDLAERAEFLVIDIHTVVDDRDRCPLAGA